MSKYRILEKKGEILKILARSRNLNHKEKLKYCKTNDLDEMIMIDKYIPRFIVQEIIKKVSRSMFTYTVYEDLKEFTDLDEAQAYKRELELEDGIVRD